MTYHYWDADLDLQHHFHSGGVRLAPHSPHQKTLAYEDAAEAVEVRRGLMCPKDVCQSHWLQESYR